MRLINTLFLSALAVVPSALGLGLESYDNDFVDPSYILAKSFSPETAGAQQTVVQWADEYAAQGPWSVMNKSVTPPSGNKHDYLSWAPYSWPNCTGVDNATALTPEEIWVECPYYTRDGMFNPDGRLVNNTGDFQAMSDGILYNAIAWVITGSDNYASNIANWVDTWFINPDTYMTPNLNYAQMNRGPTGQVGTHTGVLDLKGMTKITSGILMLRAANSSAWTDELNTQFMNWTSSYIDWLTTDSIALQEMAATNNHGSFYFNQLTSLYILMGDKTSAMNSTNTYFNGIYMNQINSTGDQPLEAVRTRPYHYRCYNLAAMITNARLGDYLGMVPSFWNKTTTAGTTIHQALDFAMTVPPGEDTASELNPEVAAVAATYGDPSGKYAAFLAAANVTYPAEPYFLWDQPLSDSNLAAATPSATSGAASSTSGSHNGALSMFHASSTLYSVLFVSLSALLWV